LNPRSLEWFPNMQILANDSPCVGSPGCSLAPVLVRRAQPNPRPPALRHSTLSVGPANPGLAVDAVPFVRRLPVGIVARTGKLRSSPPSLWIANHTITNLWDGAADDAASAGAALPIGILLPRVTGNNVGRADWPVFLRRETRRSPPQDGWVDVERHRSHRSGRAPDWSEPDFPPRRLTLGQRGEVVRGDSPASPADRPHL